MVKLFVFQFIGDFAFIENKINKNDLVRIRWVKWQYRRVSSNYRTDICRVI